MRLVSLMFLVELFTSRRMVDTAVRILLLSNACLPP